MVAVPMTPAAPVTTATLPSRRIFAISRGRANVDRGDYFIWNAG
jgi:hypothetical protein